MLAVGEYDARDCHAVLVLHRIANDGVGVLAAFPIRHDIEGALVVALVDIRLMYELVDAYGVCAFHFYGFGLFCLDGDVATIAQLLAAALLSMSTTSPISSSIIC